MKLNNESLGKIRKKIEKELTQLTNLPSDVRVKLDKKLLETLIFEDTTYKGKTCKVPVWTGKFLSRLDLSEISFDGVLFSLGRGPYDFSDTNIKIDFSKCADYGLHMVDFSGVDLSKSNLNVIGYFYDVDLSNTYIDLSDISEDAVFCRECDFSFNDFKRKNLNICDLKIEGSSLIHFRNCALNICYDDSDLGDLSKSAHLQKELRSGCLDGCFINGKVIKCGTISDRYHSSEKLKKEYLALEKKITDDIVSTIKTYKKS